MTSRPKKEDSMSLSKGQNERKLSNECRSYFNIHYDKLVEKGFEEHALKKKPPGKRGRPKKSKSRNMVERFKAHKEDILRSMNNFNVPFDNNLAERAIRMMRLKQKVSGVLEVRPVRILLLSSEAILILCVKMESV